MDNSVLKLALRSYHLTDHMKEHKGKEAAGNGNSAANGPSVSGKRGSMTCKLTVKLLSGELGLM